MQSHNHVDRQCECGIDGPLPAESDRSRMPSSVRLEDQASRRIELREEELIPRKELREVGEVQIRTEVEEIPRSLDVEALREEVEVEHVPIGQVVSERREPWDDGDVLVVPVYEEQVVTTKRLVMREQLRIRRVATRETQHFEDIVRRERLIVEDPADTGQVHERYPVQRTDDERRESAPGHTEDSGFLEKMVRKALQ